MIDVYDVYGNQYRIDPMYHEHFIECQYNWMHVPKSEHEAAILAEFAEELVKVNHCRLNRGATVRMN